jgi:nucleoside-diphosphate-sugar epimerase
MKILILGSDGQIGARLTDYLRGLNHDVIEFDNHLNPMQDLRVPGVLDDIIPGVDFVFFLAFDVGGSVYLKKNQDTYQFISNNIKIMNYTFDSLKKYNIPFIFTSSQMSEMNHSSYGTLKRIGEKYTNSLNGKTIKFWNVYGTKWTGEKSYVIINFIKMAKENNHIYMNTTGQEARQFLYVDDCCKCMNIIMERFNEIKEQQLDVSSFEWIKIKEIAKIVSSHFNDCPVHPSNEVDDVQRSLLKEPCRDILKYWAPEISIESGIKNIINELDTR